MKKEQLIDMEKLDIRTVKKESLVDLKDVKIDKSKPKSERIEEFIAQVKNPYCCICDGIIVKMKFSDQETTLEEKLKNYFSSI